MLPFIKPSIEKVGKKVREKWVDRDHLREWPKRVLKRKGQEESGLRRGLEIDRQNQRVRERG